MLLCKMCLTTPAYSFVDKLGRSYTREYCKSCQEIRTKDRILKKRNSSQGKQYHKNYKLLAKFGISYEEYKAMLAEQAGVCAICCNPPNFNSLQVDHCHNTGNVRSLLCFHCNTALGHIKDDVSIAERMLEYLRKHATI
jgi:hypothetical protein